MERIHTAPPSARSWQQAMGRCKQPHLATRWRVVQMRAWPKPFAAGRAKLLRPHAIPYRTRTYLHTCSRPPFANHHSRNTCISPPSCKPIADRHMPRAGGAATTSTFINNLVFPRTSQLVCNRIQFPRVAFGIISAANCAAQLPAHTARILHRNNLAAYNLAVNDACRDCLLPLSHELGCSDASI